MEKINVEKEIRLPISDLLFHYDSLLHIQKSLEKNLEIKYNSEIYYLNKKMERMEKEIKEIKRLLKIKSKQLKQKQ